MPGVVRFGRFALDVRSGELRKDGLRVRLSEQPFRVLEALLREPGQVVLRDELRKTVWRGKSFGDFEHGINKVVNKLREALGDTAENAVFVETVAKRGYRFIAPVTREVEAGASKPRIAVSGFEEIGGEDSSGFAAGLPEERV